jgi:hypothetical protein
MADKIELTELRERHVEFVIDPNVSICEGCSDDSGTGSIRWPCDASLFIAEVERLGGFVAEMQPELGKLKTENERFRAALDWIWNQSEDLASAQWAARVALGHPNCPYD